jgi:hypothetical protein
MVILDWCAAALPWKPISGSSRRTDLVLTLLPEAVWSSVVGAMVAPRRVHFTVDRGSSSRAEIWQTDLLERWNPMTVPCKKTLTSSVRPFYCQCLSMEIASLCAWFYTPVSNSCGWNCESTNFRCVHILLYVWCNCMQKIADGQTPVLSITVISYLVSHLKDGNRTKYSSICAAYSDWHIYVILMCFYMA